MSAARVALLIDAENIGADRFPAILALASRFGDPVIKRLFGLRKDWEPVARAHALKVEWQASGGKGKNTVDIAMTVHAMDIVRQRLADALCLVSSDCDFQPLAIHLREAGETVYGIGEDKTDESLRKAYAAFYVLPSLPPTPSETAPKPSVSTVAVPAAVSKKAVKSPKPAATGSDHRVDSLIVGLMPEDGAWVTLSAIGSALHSKHPQIAASLKNGKLAKRLQASPLVKGRVTGHQIEFCRPLKPS